MTPGPSPGAGAGAQELRIGFKAAVDGSDPHQNYTPNRNVQLQLVINNLLNDRTVYWTTSTNGAATTALRPRDGNYASPARETVPVGFGQ